VIKILGKREGAEVLLITLGDFPDADSSHLAPRPRDTFGPFQHVYETNGACLLQGERLRETEDANGRLYL
jgi:hypothetical protein